MKDLSDLKRNGVRIAVEQLLYSEEGVEPGDDEFEQRLTGLFCRLPEVGVAYYDASNNHEEMVRWHEVVASRAHQAELMAKLVDGEGQ